MIKLLWKTLKLVVLLGVVLLIATPVALVIWGVEKQPLVLVGQTMNYEHVSRLHRIIKSHDPRRMRPGEVKHLVTVEDDLNLVLQYALSGLRETGARLSVEQDRATSRISVGLEQFKLDGYLNITAALAQRGQEFWIQDVKIGQINVPDFISKVFSRVGHELLLSHTQYRDSISAINRLNFQPQQMVLVYQWRPELVKELVATHRELFSSEQVTERVALYQEQIAEISMKLKIITPAVSLLNPLFDFAYQRSRTPEQAVAENQALLTALGMYMAGSSVQQLLGGKEKPVQKRAVRCYLTLSGRYDLTQHFILSAYLANAAGEGVADGLGLFKEFKDSQGGSGFSFADLAADRAGQRLAELATQPETAKRIQNLMRTAKQESLFMPKIDQLPEGIQEIEFKARYGSLQSDDYKTIEDEIERRLRACAAYAS